MASDWETLRFQPWSSAPDASFWQRLAALKLDTFQLSDHAQELTGYFAPGRAASVPSRLTVDDSSFHTADAQDNDGGADRARYEWKAPGVLINTNTLEDFKTLDKAAVLQQAGERILAAALSPSAAAGSVDQLNAFVLVTFADLKKHSFLYWFGFPALTPATPYKSRAPVAVAAALTLAEQTHALDGLLRLRRESLQAPAGPSPFFVVERLGGDAVRVLTLEAWSQRPEAAAADVAETLFGFVDPCPLATNPGWPMRNLLAFLTARAAPRLPQGQPLRVIAFREHLHHLREAPAAFEWTHSLLFEVAVAVAADDAAPARDVRVTGWEPNARGKLGPRLMELSGLLDPIRLAETSVDLNLKLMRWRQLPALDLEAIARTKCLLLGAGTLGCYTGRSLLSWGFRHITFVDNSTVSHSNPVRQPLFEFQDCGKPKAACAANALKRVFPLVDARAEHLTIPMAGHALSNAELVDEAKRGLARLEQLIDEHDVVFLGTDSRESRWLPTVIAAAKRKLLLNSALGFDSYLVMRHGVRRAADPHSDPPAAAALGCYFCNDVVSPRDSLKDRTLDQMCTVTRPGLAPIASATAVELLVAVLHAPEGKYVGVAKPADAAAPLAFVPHQLRGFLNAFHTLPITGEAFDRCIACSARVLAAYEADAFALLQHACDSSSYLEDLTGLSALTQEVDALSFELDDSDDDSELA
ncbi:hypothetical protein PybrP1_011125 [[Pythium] brassicae (nom. inval.)]|nr:hypothetical protein PybrP1_011125 [[Pythium] brassicae (nom. inval.)]